jgi:hypothetical protein
LSIAISRTQRIRGYHYSDLPRAEGCYLVLQENVEYSPLIVPLLRNTKSRIESTQISFPKRRTFFNREELITRAEGNREASLRPEAKEKGEVGMGSKVFSIDWGIGVSVKISEKYPECSQRK